LLRYAGVEIDRADIFSAALLWKGVGAVSLLKGYGCRYPVESVRVQLFCWNSVGATVLLKVWGYNWKFRGCNFLLKGCGSHCPFEKARASLSCWGCYFPVRRVWVPQFFWQGYCYCPMIRLLVPLSCWKVEGVTFLVKG
jgi:hypothetical protein